MTSTHARICSFTALSKFLCSQNEAASWSNLYWIAYCSMPVALVGYSGVDPGFDGGLKSVAGRVAYTAGVIVDFRYPRPPPPPPCSSGWRRRSCLFCWRYRRYNLSLGIRRSVEWWDWGKSPLFYPQSLSWRSVGEGRIGRWCRVSQGWCLGS